MAINCDGNMSASGSGSNATNAWLERFGLISSVFILTAFGIVFTVGLIGNATLIYTILANKWMRTKSNVLIVSLAAGDFLLILVSVPLTAITYTTDGWWYGEAMCKLYEFLQTFSVAVSVLTLTALSGDRHIAIVFPLYVYKSRSMRKTVCVAVAIWIVSLLLAIPDLVSTYVNTCGMIPYCSAYHYDWGAWYPKFRTIFRFVVLFACPLIIIAVFYVIIAFALVHRSRDTFYALHAGDANVRQLDSRRKVANIVLIFVAIFAVCWLPRHVYLLSWHYADITFNAYWHMFKATGFCLTFVYSAVNPFALYLINDQFRSYFNHYLCGRCVKSCRLPMDVERRRSSLTSLPTTAQRKISLEDLMERLRSGSLPPLVTQAVIGKRRMTS